MIDESNRPIFLYICVLCGLERVSGRFFGLIGQLVCIGSVFGLCVFSALMGYLIVSLSRLSKRHSPKITLPARRFALNVKYYKGDSLKAGQFFDLPGSLSIIADHWGKVGSLSENSMCGAGNPFSSLDAGS